MALIGLVGKIGSGKTEVARIVQELYPEMNWIEKGFADKLRQVASLLTGIPAEEMKKQEVKESLIGPEWNLEMDDGTTRMMNLRGLLQMLGTQTIRDVIHPNSWVNALFTDYKPIYKIGHDPVFGEYQAMSQDVYPNWLLADTRFKNELEAITSRGGTCIRIIRPDNPHPQSNHESETALDGVELLTIINDGNLDQLRIKVKDIFDPIVKRCNT